MPIRTGILLCCLCCAMVLALPACRGGRAGKGGGRPADRDTEVPGTDIEVSGVSPGEGKPGGDSTQVKGNKSSKKKEKTVLDDGVTQVQVPGGDYIFGSTTGEPFRDPSKEIDAHKVTVEPFLIDRYPYPNQKGVEPKTNVSCDGAGKLCEKEGKRLCTELEWEIACKGPDNEQVPEGGVSGFGMAGLFEVYEWTASQWLEPELPNPRGRVVKSFASAQMALGKPRCSARSVRQDDKATGNLGFRCCQGETNEIQAVLEPLKKPFEEVKDFPLDKFQLLVRSTPEMKDVKDDPKMFSEEDKRYVLLRREIDVEKEYAGYIFTNSPVWWRPVRGEELLVMTGFSGKHSFVLALYHLGEGKFKHASSLVLLESDAATVQLPIPLILVAGVDRTVINWAPCWNCSEGGSLYLDDKIDSEHTGDFLIHLSYRWGP
jgi:hypothetical protein